MFETAAHRCTVNSCATQCALHSVPCAVCHRQKEGRKEGGREGRRKKEACQPLLTKTKTKRQRDKEKDLKQNVLASKQREDTAD